MKIGKKPAVYLAQLETTSETPGETPGETPSETTSKRGKKP